MKNRKKYGNGSGRQGVGPTNYITNPSETLADYNIMLGKAENEALSNPWLPVTSMLGSLLQTGLGIAGNYAGAKATAKNGSSGLTKDVEVEGEEAFETPSGETGIFKGPSHEQGGIPMKVGKDIPVGTTVYSDRLKGADGLTMAERKARREAAEQKILTRLNKNKTDLALKNGAKRQMEVLEKEEQQDLQLQELVSQFQNMAQKAFGTGKQGVQKMDKGTGPDGIEPFEYMKGDANLNHISDTLENNPNINAEALKNFKIGDGINDNASLSYGNPYAKDGINYQTPTTTKMTPVENYGTGVKTPILPAKKIFDPGYLPKIGDAVGLIGNYFSATQPAKVTAEQRSTDVAHTNVYENYGKAALKNLDNSETYIEGQKKAQIQKIISQSRAGKKSARNSARGVNQQRAMDWLYDTSTAQAIADAFTGANNTMIGIQDRKATVNNQRDEARGKGRWDADIADEKAKDAYYTAKGVNTATTGKFIQQTGKELNQIAMNPQMLQLMEQLGKYVKFDSNGKMVAKT